jgi:hypothetical protein
MTRDFLSSNLLPCAGLIVPPLLWAALTQAGEIFPGYTCATHLHVLSIVAAASLTISLAATAGAWRAGRGAGDTATVYPLSFDLVRLLSLGTGLVFAFAIALQGVASLVLNGCER